MSFNGSEGGFITLEKGSAMTAAYRAKFPGSTKARFIGKDKLLEVLEQPGCMGIRVYFACGEEELRSTTTNLEVVTVGADANQNDMLDLILDLTIGCPGTPPNGACSAPNPLNS